MSSWPLNTHKAPVKAVQLGNMPRLRAEGNARTVISDELEAMFGVLQGLLNIGIIVFFM